MRTPAAVALLWLLAPIAAFPQETVPPAPAASTSVSGTAAAATGAAASGGTAAPQPAAPPKPDALPKDASTEWRVGVTVFSAGGLSPDNAYLPYSLPLLLKDEVSGLTTHAYTDGEKALLRQALVDRERASAEKNLTSVRHDQDAVFFERVPDGAASRIAVQARLAAAQARIDFLRGLDPGLIDVSDGKPVTFPQGTGAGSLMPAPTVPPEVYCAQQNLDLLVGGTLQEVQGYLLLDVWAFDPLSKKRVFFARNAASRDELYATMPGFGDEIARTILGRPWALVHYFPDPPTANLFVDGRQTASGTTPTIYLSPGPHEIRLAAAGYRDSSRSLVLEPDTETRVTDSLEKDVIGEIAVSSQPTGANLYVDSRWVGKTPIAFDRPPVRSRGVLSLEGYYNLNFSVGPASPPQLDLQLQKDVGSKDELQKKARDEFYVALGFFAFSLPVPVFTYGFLIDSQVKQIDLQSQGLGSAVSREQMIGTALQGTYYVGVAVSAALFTWMVTRIIHYVRVANEIAG